jgi:hypothetical protein
MTEVEALLSVDAGRVPAGVVAFRPRDRGAVTRRFRIVLAVTCALAAVASALTGVGRELVALLVLGAGIFGVLASPDQQDDDVEVPSKPPALLLTPTGLIVRDAFGLRCWRYAELLEVRQVCSRGESGLLIVGRDQSSDFVDTGDFERGESLWALLRAVVPPAVSAGEVPGSRQAAPS